MPGVSGERACLVSVCGRWELTRLFFRGGGGLIFRGVHPCSQLLGGNHFVVTPATTVAHASPGDHESRAWWQVVPRASVKHRQSYHLSWRVVPHRAACFCCSMESTIGETCWACVLRTGACSSRWCGTQCGGDCSLRLTVVYGACGTFLSPMTGKRSMAKVPLEPPFAIVCASAAGMRPVFKLPVRACHRRASSTSSGVLRALLPLPVFYVPCTHTGYVYENV